MDMMENKDMEMELIIAGLQRKIDKQKARARKEKMQDGLITALAVIIKLMVTVAMLFATVYLLLGGGLVRGLFLVTLAIPAFLWVPELNKIERSIRRSLR